VTSTIAYIYINVSSSDYAVSSKDSAQFASILEHEMTHGFGYGDTYLHINNDPGLMGNGINTTPPTTWKTDSLLLSSIKATNASPAHKITIGNNNACNLICPDGSTATTTSSGSYSCTPPPVTPTSTPSVAPTSTTPTSTPPVTTTPTGTAGGSSGGSVIINGTNHGTVINVNLPGASSSTSPGGWVENFYQFALMIAGVLAFAVVVYGGIRYMTAVGNPSGEEDAKEWIWAALTGLLLLAGAYIILNVVNPQILNLTLPTLKNVSTTSGGGIFGDNNASSTASSTATSTGACPLTALPTLTDPVAISEENGQTVLWTASDPNVQKNLTQLQAEFKKMQAKFPSAQPNSVYRAMQ